MGAHFLGGAGGAGPNCARWEITEDQGSESESRRGSEFVSQDQEENQGSEDQDQEQDQDLDPRIKKRIRVLSQDQGEDQGLDPRIKKRIGARPHRKRGSEPGLMT